MTEQQWRTREHEPLIPLARAIAPWAEQLAKWLETRGYVSRETGSYNSATGRGWYSHPCEYQRGHVRVRINPGGVIILRDPGCTIETSRPAPGTGGMREILAPNMCRIDYPYPGGETTAVMQTHIEIFENRPAWTLDQLEAWANA